MTRQFDVDRTLESWLTDGPTRMPGHLVDSIVIQLEETHQRKHLWLPGREQMNRMMVTVGGIAAVALLAVVGLYFLGNRPGIGIPATASPTPTPTPTPIPTVLPAGTVAAGRFFTELDGYRYSFTVSGTGWEASDTKDAVMQGDHDNNPSDFGSLFLWYGINGLYTEPCQWTGTFANPGDTAAEWATALAGLSGFDTTQPTDLAISGYPGKRMQLTVPADATLTGCEQNEYRSFDGRYYQLNGQVDDIRLVDANGKRLMIRTTYDPGTSATVRAELEQMVDSMEITPLTP